MSTVPEHLRDALARAQRRQPETGEALRRYAERVLGVRRGEPLAQPLDVAPYQTMGLLTRAEAERIARLTGIEAIERELWDWTVDASSVRHIHERHGQDPRPVVPGDYALLPRILAEADTIEPAGKSWRSGLPVIRLRARRGDDEMIAVFEARAGRRMMALDSFYARRLRR